MLDMLHRPYFLLLVVALVFLTLIASSPAKKRGRSAESRTASEGAEFKFKEILSATETRFFRQLTSALPTEWVFPQVAMSAVLQPAARGRGQAFWRSFGKISQKRIDFIVYDGHFELIAVIELDDPSHDSKKADDLVRDKFLADAGIRTIRFDVRSWPDAAAIRRAVFPNPGGASEAVGARDAAAASALVAVITTESVAPATSARLIQMKSPEEGM